MKKWYGYLLLLLTALIWGMAFSAQSAGMEHMGPFTFQSVRCFLGAFALLPVVLIRGHLRAKKNAAPAGCRPNDAQTADPAEKSGRPAVIRKKITGGLVCGTVLCVACCLQQIGIKYTTVGKAGFLTALYVLLVPFMGLIVFRKSVPRKIYLCVAAATFGLYLLNGSDGAGINIGDVFCILSAVGFAMHILVVDHFVQDIDGLELSCMQFFVSGIISGIPMLIVEAPAFSELIAGGLPLLYAGIVSCGVGYTLQIVGQKYVEPVTATLIMSLESVFALLGGALLLAQIPTAMELAGCMLILAAVLYAQIPSRRAA